MYLRRAVILGLLSLAFSDITIASAETVYDTFRFDGGFYGTKGYFIGAGEPLGTQFVVPGSDPVHLQSITLGAMATYWGGSGPASIQVTVRENTGDNSPGVILDMIERNDIGPNPPTYAAGTYSFASVLNPLLYPGVPYWIVAENSGSDSVKPFWFSSVLDVRDPLVELRGGSWYQYDSTSATTPALRVDVTTVPEPSMIALSGSGLAGLLFMAWRRGRAKPGAFPPNR